MTLVNTFPPQKQTEASAEFRSLLSEEDLYLFNEGTHRKLYERLGAHLHEINGIKGVFFAVWAPDAEGVSVIGDFNHWTPDKNNLHPRGSSGIWEGFVPDISEKTIYKYQIRSRYNGYSVQKADPFAFYSEVPPKTASIVWNHTHEWKDADWMKTRGRLNPQHSPLAVYEMHFGSWKRVPEEGNRSYTYREIAPKLVEFIKETGFTHVEFMPLMEHPFFGSWGYQISGYYSPTSRFGTPEDLMFLIDYLHQNEIGVILDWVPSHFPSDEHGLCYFDGTHLYEHQDPRQRIQPDWDSLIFNYSRNEVKAFLLSNAFYWLDKFHADGLRVDAVASMLYLDYSRKEGEWIPNKYGGRENLDAIDFLRQLNTDVFAEFPDALMIAEESTSWPMVSRPIYLGGLGFNMKWDMGWMHDTLKYMAREAIHRKYHHDNLNFRMIYAFTENFLLPLSHDEVVHGKRSLLDKMPGDMWQKFANLRLLYGYMWAMPGKKLLFMGGEVAQWSEWHHEDSVDWNLLDFDFHKGVYKLIQDLNKLYRSRPELHDADFEPEGFEWIDCNDGDNSVYSFLRRTRHADRWIAVVCNFTPVPRYDYRIGVPIPGKWTEILNTDAEDYWGSGVGNLGGVQTVPEEMHGRPYSLSITLPPLGAVYLQGPQPK
ncbi:1,4-alpha-glucan branching protein GlgB [bacterium]|nr:1,4-alpha-glucan branching protein GlgB [bacterium]